MVVHNIKIEYPFAVDIIKGIKTFEIRYNDRNYKTGDLIKFNVTNVPEKDPYCTVFNMDTSLYRIAYISDYQQKDNYIVMSIKKVKLN